MIRSTTKSARSRILKLAAVATAALFITACGGGGGSGNTVLDKPGLALFTSSPSSITVAEGGTIQHTIGGGGGGSKFTAYSATSSDVRVATASVSGTTVSITGTAPGSTTVTVSDGAGASVLINVTVPLVAIPKLSINAPDSVTLAAGMTSSYKIIGGAAPYSAVSSTPGAATASIQDGSLVISATSAGTATIKLYDAAGANVVINLTVSPDAIRNFSINAPDSVTLATGMTSSYQIIGGAAPYSAVSSTPAVATASIQNGSLVITGTNPGTATIMVYDATGASGKVELTVGSGGAPIALYTTAPSPVGIPKDGSTIEYAVNGGVAPYTATSGDLTVLSAQMSGNKLLIRGIAIGVAKVAIVDSVGATVTLNVGVIGEEVVATPLYTTAPSTLSISAGAAPPYTVAGGNGAYTVSTSNPGVATATITSGKTLKITGLSAGVADIVVFDSTGTSVRISVTVGGGTGTVPLYSTSPDVITVVTGATPSFTIAGGAGPYVATSSNVNAATVAQVGNTFTVTGVAAGAAVIAIHDANGSAITIEVTVL